MITPYTDEKLQVPLHVNTFYPHERIILNDDHQFKVICAHRKARKTTILLNEALLNALSAKTPGIYFIVFPTSTMARDIIWRDPAQLWRVIPKEVIAKVREVEMDIVLTNGSIIAVRGSDDKDRLTGTSGKFYALDEFSIMKPEVFDQVVMPVAKSLGSKVIISGTPRGKNRFYELFENGNDHVNYPEWQSFYYPVTKTQVYTQEGIDNLKAQMSERLFAQEMMCEWLNSSGTVFRGLEAVLNARFEQPKEGELYVIGVDLGRLQDYTAITVWKRSTNSMVYLETIKELDWNFQCKKIHRIVEHYNNALAVVEANSIGDPVVDTLARMGVAVQPFKTTYGSKKEAIEKLSLWIESRKIHLLKETELIRQFEAFGYELTQQGAVKYGAMGSQHDDIVMSCALAVSFLNPLLQGKAKEEDESLLHQAKLRAYEDQYNRLCNLDIVTSEEWGEWGAVD